MNRPEPITAPDAAEPSDGLANPQRLMAFSTLAMAITMAVLDGTIVTVALPTMAREFAVAPENAIWIVNAFQLAVTVSLLPLAALGDMFGYRRVYWWGLALFTVASLACALAPTFAVLTFARLVQGLGAAGIMSVNIALIRFIYPHARLGQGVGNMAVVVAVAIGRKPERRRGDPFGRLMALAVSHQRADRRSGAHHGGADAAGDAARRRAPRSSERHSQRAHVRARHRRRQRDRPRRKAMAGAD